MNREHLYKAKRKGSNKEWIEGYYAKIGDRHFILTAFGANKGFTDFVEINSDTVCEYTGLQDKNGKKIFEGDIVQCLETECCGYISWDDEETGFYFMVLLEDGGYEEEHLYDYVDELEIIGNVFDNPELLT